MPKSNSDRSRPHLAGLAIALMCAFAGGALWCLASLYARRDLAPLAFVVALIVVWQLRGNGWGGRWSGALAAAASVALAAVYSYGLQAVAQVASMFSLPMREAMTRMNLSMVLDIARANFVGSSRIVVVSAILVAAALMLRRPRTPPLADAGKS